MTADHTGHFLTITSVIENSVKLLTHSEVFVGSGLLVQVLGSWNLLRDLNRVNERRICD